MLRRGRFRRVWAVMTVHSDAPTAGWPATGEWRRPGHDWAPIQGPWRSGGGGTDKFRIKIWDKNNGDAVVYDNKLGAADEDYDAQQISGGSIVIHKSS